MTFQCMIQFVLWIPLLLQVTLWKLVVINAQEPTTCDFGDGVVFQAGESLGDLFTTRCGTSAEFPCFCRPGSDPPIDCPYCGITTYDVTDFSEVYFCVNIGENDISVIDPQGEEQMCRCDLQTDGRAVTICQDDNIQLPPVDDDGGGFGGDDDICILELEDGTQVEFFKGESFGSLFPTRCGSTLDFPCFCDPSLPNQVDCPYCAAATSSNDLACAAVDETVTFVDANTQQQVQCTCQPSFEFACSPPGTPTNPPTLTPTTLSPTISTTAMTLPPSTESLSPVEDAPSVPTDIGETSPPTSFPTPVPSPIPTIGATQPPSSPSSTASPTVTIISPPSVDKPSLLLPNRPPVAIPTAPPGCGFTKADGSFGFIPPGDAFPEDAIENHPCLPIPDFPVFCNPDLPGSIEYPYCVFGGSTVEDGDVSEQQSAVADTESPSTSFICASNDQRVTVTTEFGLFKCSCLYVDAFIGPVSSCPELTVEVPLTIRTAPPSPAPTPESTVPQPTKSPTLSGAPASLYYHVWGLGIVTVVGWLHYFYD